MLPDRCKSSILLRILTNKKKGSDQPTCLIEALLLVAFPYLALGPAARIASEASNFSKLASKRLAKSAACRS
jgi:hypothetical protein